jgi:hypothetical protein
LRGPTTERPPNVGLVACDRFVEHATE